MTRQRKPDILNTDGQVNRCFDARSANAFSVIEAIVMLIVLAVFTLIVIALLIREAGNAKNEIQKEVSCPAAEESSRDDLDFYLG